MIVLDSSFLIAHAVEKDAHHAEALAVMERLAAGEWGDALLPEYVLVEVATVVASRVGLDASVAVADALLGAAKVSFVPAADHVAATLDVFRRQPKARLSFTDAAIVAVARSRGATHVASFDTDFRGVPGIKLVP